MDVRLVILLFALLGQILEVMQYEADSVDGVEQAHSTRPVKKNTGNFIGLSLETVAEITLQRTDTTHDLSSESREAIAMLGCVRVLCTRRVCGRRGLIWLYKVTACYGQRSGV